VSVSHSVTSLLCFLIPSLCLSLFCHSRALPFVILIPLLTQTVKTASLLAAIAALDVEVIGEVLEETKERVELIKELRDKITCRTRGSNFTQQELLEAVFQEIDSDGSGEINKKEFQEMLVKLEMCYSGKKFDSLYNAIDRNNDGSLSINELNHILFPQVAQEQEAHEIAAKVQSHLDQELNHLEQAVSQKRSEKISSLKSLKTLTLAAQAAKTWQQRASPKSTAEVKSERKFPDDGVPRSPSTEKESSPQVPSLRKKMAAQQILRALHSAQAASTAASPAAEGGDIVSEAVGNPIRENNDSPNAPVSAPSKGVDATKADPSSAQSAMPPEESHSSPPLVLPVRVPHSPLRPTANTSPLPSQEEQASCVHSPPQSRHLGGLHPSSPLISSLAHVSPPQSEPPSVGLSPVNPHPIQRVRRHLLESNRIEPFDPSAASASHLAATPSLPVRSSARQGSERRGRGEGHDRRRRITHSLSTEIPQDSVSLPNSPLRFSHPRTPLPAAYQNGLVQSPSEGHISHRHPRPRPRPQQLSFNAEFVPSDCDETSPTHLRHTQRRRSNSWDIGGSFDSNDDRERDRDRDRDRDEQPDRGQQQPHQRRFQHYPTSRSYQI
jgi:Ca2+-binding EF-hand superfamily protein